jgi:hypothetical protein
MTSLLLPRSAVSGATPKGFRVVQKKASNAVQNGLQNEAEPPSSQEEVSSLEEEEEEEEDSYSMIL